MGNGESTSRRVSMQRADDGSIQISEDVMYRLKGVDKQVGQSQEVKLGKEESIVHEDELKLMIENAFLQGRKHEYDKNKEKFDALNDALNDKKGGILKKHEEELEEKEIKHKQQLVELEEKLQVQFKEELAAKEADVPQKYEEITKGLTEDNESYKKENKSLSETVEKLTEEKGILENKVAIREQEIQQEFDKKVEVVQEKIKPLQESSICIESQESVLACYKLNKTQPLKCAKEVKEFVNCVQNTRLKYMQKHLIEGGR